MRNGLEAHEEPGGEGDDAQNLADRTHAVAQIGKGGLHRREAALVMDDRAGEADENAEREADGERGLHTGREPPVAADGRRRGDGHRGEGDLAHPHVKAGQAVVEAEPEDVAERVVRDDRQRGGVGPHDGHVGEDQEPGAEEPVVVPERLHGPGVGPARPRAAVRHGVVVPGDDGHGDTAGEDAQHRPERARLGQEGRARHDERAPSHGTPERQRPRPEGRNAG